MKCRAVYDENDKLIYYKCIIGTIQRSFLLNSIKDEKGDNANIINEGFMKFGLDILSDAHLWVDVEGLNTEYERIRFKVLLELAAKLVSLNHPFDIYIEDCDEYNKILSELKTGN